MKKLVLATLVVLFTASMVFAANYETIRVPNGASIQQIARATLKDAGMWRELLEFNNLSSPAEVRAGMTMNIPYSISKNRVARVTSKVGTVQVKDGNNWTNVYVNQVILKDTIIKTSGSSRVNIELDEGSVLRVGPNTQIELAGYDYQNGARNTNLGLTAGSVALRVTKLAADSTFQVSTVTAVAGVRGTSFFVELNEENDVDIAVYQGAVGVQSTTVEENIEIEPVVVETGFATRVSAEGDVTQPYAIPGKIEWID